MKSKAVSLAFRYLCCFLFLIAIFLRGVPISSDYGQDPTARDCGSSVPTRTEYSFSGPRASVPPLFPTPTVLLEAVLPFENHSRILMRIEKPNGRPLQFISDDMGEKWHQCDWELGYSNLPTWSESERLMSRVDRQVLYDCYFICKNGFRRSKDGGASWTRVNPTISGRDAIEEIQLQDTGSHFANRVYATVWSNNRQNFRAAVSNDYGESFELLSRDVGHVVEARANSDVLYASLPNKELLGISRDYGSTWTTLQSSGEIWKALFVSRGRIYGQKQYPDDEEWLSPYKIQQIETDPADANLIYVLTEKGLYMSRDAGGNFRLASLAKGRLRSIDRIAVDPVHGRYVYAVIDLGQFYRSSDFGCSWQRMKLPALWP